jgi:hypothetical protein
MSGKGWMRQSEERITARLDASLSAMDRVSIVVLVVLNLGERDG